VVGEAGSGKTTFLRELTSYLADRGAVPVPVSLRGAQPPLSFRELARQQFSASIDAHVRSEDEADRIWRTLCRERSIVVLADGLDEAVLEMSTDHRSDVVRRALNEARYQELPLVATCRSGAVPLGSSYAEVSLPPLGAEQAREYTKGRIAGPELNKKRGRVDEIVRVKGVGDTPFYLNVVAELLKADRLDTVTVHRYQGARQRDHLRMRLLDTFTQALSEGHILPVRPLQANAEEVIKELARVAGAMTFRGVLEITEPALQEACAELPTRADPLLHDLPTLVEDGTRLGLVQTLVGGNETTIRFSHALLQVYFTERLLADDASRPPPVRWLTGKAVLRTLAIRCGLRESRVRTALIERTASSELLWALAIWCNKTDNATRKLVAQELRGRAGRCRDDAALRLVVTGIEILSPLGDAPVRKMFEEDAAQAFKASGQPARLAAIRSLGEIDLPWAYDLLLDQALHGGSTRSA
jgi:NACHT domain